MVNSVDSFNCVSVPQRRGLRHTRHSMHLQTDTHTHSRAHSHTNIRTHTSPVTINCKKIITILINISCQFKKNKTKKTTQLSVESKTSEMFLHVYKRWKKGVGPIQPFYFFFYRCILYVSTTLYFLFYLLFPLLNKVEHKRDTVGLQHATLRYHTIIHRRIKM